MTDQESKEWEKVEKQLANEFLQYSYEGYSEVDNLRCTDCDCKYRGRASFGHVCPRCLALKALRSAYQQGLKEGQLAGAREGAERAVREMALEEKKPFAFDKDNNWAGGDWTIGFNSAVKELQERSTKFIKSLEKGE